MVQLEKKRLPKKLKQIRETLGLTQREMADRIGLDVHYSNISKYERGESVPSLELALAYARAGNMHFESLVDDQLELTPVVDSGKLQQ
jgi:transcriptional regulator with XRE-family HTH domain